MTGRAAAILPNLMARLLVSSGESSGEAYAAELVRHLRRQLDGRLEVTGLGGDRLAAEGASLVAHVREVAVVGIVEVLRHLRRLRAVFRDLLRVAERDRPDVALLVDYPDFNLRLARQLRRLGVPVAYYVSPQVWAWRPGRIGTIRDCVSHMMVIFPFEEAIYREAGVPVTFVGHPLVDLVRRPADLPAFLGRLGLDPGRPVVAVLPGSRVAEVGHNLPPLAGAVERLREARPDLQFLLAAAPPLADEVFAPVRRLPVRLVRGDTASVLAAAGVALVASGTATVETALLDTPMVVVYRLAPLTYALGKPFVRVSRYAMVNLVAGRPVVPEIIQSDFTPERVAREALGLLDDPARAARMREDLAEVRRLLGGPGASARAAATVASRFFPAQKRVDTTETAM